MKRRHYLTTLTTATLAGVAGCSSPSDSDTTTTRTTQATQETTTSTPEETETTAQTTTAQTAALETTGKIIRAPSVTAPRDETIPWIQTEVTNNTSAAHGILELELRLYDSDNSILETRTAFTHYIPPEETWRDYTRYYTEYPDRVDHVELRIGRQDATVRPHVIESAEVSSSTLDYTAEGGVDFAVEVNLNTTPPDQVTVLALFYDSDGRYRGTIRGIETSPRRSVAMSGARIGLRTPPNREDEYVSGFTVVVFDGVV